VDPVFLDTAYLVALLLPEDDLRAAAMAQQRATATIPKVTSDPVFVELLATASRRGPAIRIRAIAIVDQLRSDDHVTVIRQTPELFDAGLRLYRARLDKSYSLTDTMSMVICTEREIKQVLTHDHHFTQEGFKVLL
jgi:predicted nucleic acid-binding protein